MTSVLGVAEAKKRLSELMSRVVYRGERFLIRRRGRPMAALVSADDLARLEQEPAAPRGLLAAVGAWGDFEELDEVVQEIYRQRERALDRAVALDA
jgi:prevent-host-death family protein